jgi:hypothetical protein
MLNSKNLPNLSVSIECPLWEFISDGDVSRDARHHCERTRLPRRRWPPPQPRGEFEATHMQAHINKRHNGPHQSRRTRRPGLGRRGGGHPFWVSYHVEATHLQPHFQNGLAASPTTQIRCFLQNFSSSPYSTNIGDIFASSLKQSLATQVDIPQPRSLTTVCASGDKSAFALIPTRSLAAPFSLVTPPASVARRHHVSAHQKSRGISMAIV